MKVFSEELVEEARVASRVADLSQATIGEVLLVAQYLERKTGIPFIRMDQGSPGLPANRYGVEAEKKALEAGAAGIVVSNHGGRVQGGVPSTAEVLPEIADAVKGQITILVDGGIRSGVDVFRALALGADGVLIGRPVLTAIYGAGLDALENLFECVHRDNFDIVSEQVVGGAFAIGPATALKCDFLHGRKDSKWRSDGCEEAPKGTFREHFFVMK